MASTKNLIKMRVVTGENEKVSGGLVSQKASAKDRIQSGTARSTGNTAERILATASEIIAHEGVDALRLASISGRLGISPPAIYAHFPGGRQELVQQIARQGVLGMQGFFPSEGARPREELLRGISDLVGFYSENRAFLRIMLLDFSLPEGHPSISREVGRPAPFAEGAFSAMYRRLDDKLERLAAEEKARRVSAAALLNIILGATALNLIYPPSPNLEGQTLTKCVEAIVGDLTFRYLGLDFEAPGLPEDSRKNHDE